MDDWLALGELLGGVMLLGLGIFALWSVLRMLRDRELAERELRRSGQPPKPDRIDRFIERHVIKGRPLDPPPPDAEKLRRWIEVLTWSLVPIAWLILPVMLFGSDGFFWAVIAIGLVLILIQVLLFGLYVRRIPLPPEERSTTM